MRRAIIHVDRLVLKGFRYEDSQAIADGLRQELGRVFAGRDAVSHLSVMGHVSRMQVGGVHIEHGSEPVRIGEKVAHGIGKELSR